MNNQDTAQFASAAREPAPGGLTSPEAAEQLQRYGSNAVSQMRPRGVGALLRKFWGLVPWMLELAIVLDLVLGRWVEAIMIAALLVFNAVLGFFQESRAQQALALLRQRLTINARVRRDGIWQTIPASGLVPDDLIHLRVGDIIPADVHLVDGQIQVNQSQLTGESLPLERDSGSVVYAGSLVSRGEATGVVTATGARTNFGKTAALVRVAEAPRRLELLIVKITQYLAVLVVFLAIAVFASTLIRGMPLLGMLPFGLMLLVAAVPIALPAMFTMSAALGSSMLARSGILTTRLSAIEDAASMDVLCLDKTGTITENRLAVRKVHAFTPAIQEEVLRLAAMASDDATQDPIDLAILNAVKGKTISSAQVSRLEFVPFDENKKYSEGLIRQNDEVLRIIKGEPLTIAKLTQTPASKIAEDMAQLTADGSRVLAVAAGPESNLQIIGLIALGDLIRPDSKKLISDLRNKGVRVLLVTGDNEATARAVAAQVGIIGKVAPPGTLGEGVHPETVSAYEIFAGVFPQDKFFLVQALQKAGHIVGMTGDGVNDAPALKQADVGIAVANSTDVAKAAASLVLTGSGLGEIIMAINGSRMIYQRMQTFVLTMLTRKMGIPLFLALGVILSGVFVVNPLLMVLLMFATDGATMSVSMDRVLPSPMPDRWVVRSLVTTALGLAALLLLLSGAIYWTATDVLRLGVAETQTLVFVWLVFGGAQSVLYLTRRRGFFWTKPYPGRWLILSTLLDVGVAALLATQGWLMAPVSLSLVGSMLVLAFVFLVGADLLKVVLTHLAVGTSGLPGPFREGISAP